MHVNSKPGMFTVNADQLPGLMSDVHPALAPGSLTGCVIQ